MRERVLHVFGRHPLVDEKKDVSAAAFRAADDQG